MARYIFDCLSQLYGDNITVEVTEFLSTIINGMITIFQDNSISVLINITLGASVALLICYFYMDMIAKASIDMLTMEKVIMSCIKLLIGCAILIYLPSILVYMFKFTNAMYETIRDADFSISFGNTGSLANNFYFGKSKWPDYKDVQSDFEAIFKTGIKGYISNMGYIIKLIIPEILLFLSKLAAFLIAVSNAITLILYAVFSPIAVTNVFDGGMKSEAVRYLKKFLATGVTFAVIIAALKVSQVIGDAILFNALSEMNIKKLECTKEGIDAALDMNLMIKICVVRISAIGAMFGGSRIAAAIVGSNDGH